MVDDRRDAPDGADDPTDEASRDEGAYPLAPESPDRARTASARELGPSRRAAAPAHARTANAAGNGDAAGDEEGAQAEDGEEAEEGDGSLPPPISRPASARFWLIAAGSATAFLLVAWIAGAPQLVVPEPTSDGPPVIPELGPFERIAGMLRTLVYLALATLGGAFGLLSLAFVRQRPVGAIGAMFAKVAAIVAFGMLVWLVPSDIRFVKQALNVVGVPLVAGALAIPAFRISPRDAALGTGFTMMGMLFLVLLANTVVWAVA